LHDLSGHDRVEKAADELTPPPAARVDRELARERDSLVARVANDGGGITGVWDLGAEGAFTRGQPSKSERQEREGFHDLVSNMGRTTEE